MVGVTVWITAVAPGIVAAGVGVGWLLGQFGGGMPGSGVTCQQATNPLRKVHSSTARLAPTAIKIHWKMDGRLDVDCFGT